MKDKLFTPGCRVVDAHTHIGPYFMSGWRQWYSHTSTDQVLEYSERLGINAIVTAPHAIVSGDMELANRICAEATEKYIGRLYGYISVVPLCGMDAVRDQLTIYSRKKGFVGLKFLPGLYHGPLTAPEYRYAMDFAEDAACPVLCHVWEDDPRLADVEAALQNRTRMKFIIAHQGGGSARQTDRAVRIVREHPNAFLELCGSLENFYSVDDIVALAGEDKVIFGTDQINLDPKYELGRVALSALDEKAKRKVFADNFLGLLTDSAMDRIVL